LPALETVFDAVLAASCDAPPCRLAAPLRVFDEPTKALVEQFGDSTAPISQMVSGYAINVQLASSGAAELGRRQALNLVDDAAGLSKPTTTPLTKVRWDTMTRRSTPYL
jgi:hypothetical protein